MMVKRTSIVGLEADPGDLDDFDVSERAIEQALADRRMRGAQVAPTKVPVSIRLDSDIVEHFRAGGAGWQTRLNEALRRAIA